MVAEDTPAAWLCRVRAWWPQVFERLDALCVDAGRIYGGVVSYNAAMENWEGKHWPSQRMLVVSVKRENMDGRTITFVVSDTSIRVRSNSTHPTLRRGATPKSHAAWFDDLTECFASACWPYED